MIQLALWVASAIFLACCGLFLVGGIIRLCEPSSSSVKCTYEAPIDPNAGKRTAVLEEKKAIAGARKEGESLAEYSERLQVIKL